MERPSGYDLIGTVEDRKKKLVVLLKKITGILGMSRSVKQDSLQKLT